ncbi:MAG: histone deacetylase [Ignavibacteriaceae bacterium]|nr:histone deacetylase [Ignavibacteriaceae bacterium]
MKKLNTGIVFDSEFLKHDQPGHPENSKRLESIITGLKEKELFGELKLLNSRPAEINELTICHTKEYVKYVKAFCENGGGYLDPDTYSNKYSFAAASTAVGSSIDLTKAVIKGELTNGFALLRPPGHHALANKSMGFCLFGNIAIAAKVALFEPDVKKVAIVDFDVHHGNGTQAFVGDDPDILFISTHQYPFYPGTGSIRETGLGEAEGTIVNIPLQAGVGDTGFKLVYDKVVFPSLVRFKPDLILVSAGYDAHWGDPLANLNLSLTGYNWISHELIMIAERICAGKIIFFLEGGYNLEVLSNGVANSVRTLLGIETFEDPLGISVNDEPDINKLITELISIHKL